MVGDENGGSLELAPPEVGSGAGELPQWAVSSFCR